MEVIMGGPSLQPEHVLHIVDAGALSGDPGGGADGAAGENATIGRLVNEFEAFAEGGKHHGMITDHITAAQGVDTHFGGSAFAGDALATVAEGLGAEWAFLQDDFD
jgi:hypothetical protein